MLAVQALINAGLFGIAALLYVSNGLFSRPFLTFSLLTVLFATSCIAIPRFGRLPLILAWLAAIVLIVPNLPGGFMSGGMLSWPIILYLVAGLIGAIFLPEPKPQNRDIEL